MKIFFECRHVSEEKAVFEAEAGLVFGYYNCSRSTKRRDAPTADAWVRRVLLDEGLS